MSKSLDYGDDEVLALSPKPVEVRQESCIRCLFCFGPDHVCESFDDDERVLALSTVCNCSTLLNHAQELHCHLRQAPFP